MTTPCYHCAPIRRVTRAMLVGFLLAAVAFAAEVARPTDDDLLDLVPAAGCTTAQPYLRRSADGIRRDEAHCFRYCLRRHQRTGNRFCRCGVAYRVVGTTDEWEWRP